MAFMLLACGLAITATSGRAAVIGSLAGCLDNRDYPFRNATFQAPVSGNQRELDIVFGDGRYSEALVSGPVAVEL